MRAGRQHLQKRTGARIGAALCGAPGAGHAPPDGVGSPGVMWGNASGQAAGDLFICLHPHMGRCMRWRGDWQLGGHANEGDDPFGCCIRSPG
jgi:hypothetical protein